MPNLEMQRQMKGKSHGGVRVRALALLFLLSHAFLVSATHFHRVNLNHLSATEAVVSASNESGGQTAKEAANHSQCLLCRLQRNFVFNLQPSTPLLTRPQNVSLAATNSTRIFHSDHARSLPRGRAPPLA